MAESCFDDNFDPFLQDVVSNEAIISNISNSTDREELQSKHYLDSLETKLRRLKGKELTTPSSNFTSKQMLRSLQQAKEDVIKRLVAGDAPIITDTILDSRDDMEVSNVKRRVFPEQPLNEEEIQCLTERDYLGKLVKTLQEESPEQSPTESQLSDT